MECIQCGAYEISSSALMSVRHFDVRERATLSAWIRENPVEVILTNHLEQLEEIRKPTIGARADRMLRYVASKAPAGKFFSFYADSATSTNPSLPANQLASPLLAIGWNTDDAETIYMLERVLCSELGHLEEIASATRGTYRVSPKGWVALEANPKSRSSVGFCAMWFANEVQPLYDHAISPAIRAAGYEPLRIDQKEHTNKIDDEIIASIRSSRFVVADYTGNRGGVYYEAGFAHGLGLPVFFMARESESLHFDVRQYNTIFWKPDDLEDARKRLTNRILATIGSGPLKAE
jgi:hypothetical protein